MTTFFLRNIDGISYGAIVRGDTSIPNSMEHLKTVDWQLLQYKGKAPKRGVR